MITITLEGGCWQDILDEMSIIEASVSGSRIEDLPDKGIVAPDDREGHDGQMCAYCDGPVDKPWQTYQKDGRLFCSKRCSDRFDYIPMRAPRIDDLPEQTNIAKDCQKCLRDNQVVTREILKQIMRYCSLGPEEMAEILERVR